MKELEMNQMFLEWGKQQFHTDRVECGIEDITYINWDDEGLNLKEWVYGKLYESFEWTKEDLTSHSADYWLEYYADLYCQGYNSEYCYWVN